MQTIVEVKSPKKKREATLKHLKSHENVKNKFMDVYIRENAFTYLSKKHFQRITKEIVDLEESEVTKHTIEAIFVKLRLTSSMLYINDFPLVFSS